MSHRHSGVATLLAILMLTFVALALAAITRLAAADLARTRDAAADAQLRQLLLAGLDQLAADAPVEAPAGLRLTAEPAGDNAFTLTASTGRRTAVVASEWDALANGTRRLTRTHPTSTGTATP